MKDRVISHISCHTCPVAKLCLPHGLAAEEVNLFNSKIQHVKTYAPGEHIFFSQSSIQYFYAVYEGVCKDYFLDEEGNERVIDFYFPGDLIGLELLNKKTYPFSAVAIKDTKLCVISVKVFFEFLNNNPACHKRIFNILSYKIINNAYFQLNVTAQQKVAAFYVNFIKRYKGTYRNDQAIPIILSQIDISNKLRLANETLNRVLHSFGENNLLEIKHHHILHADIKGLEKIMTIF